MLIETSAPGRLDVMGGIADYSGSLVLQMPVAQRTTVKLQLRTDYRCEIKSYIGSSQPWVLELDYRDLLLNKQADYAFANTHLTQRKQIWAGYIIGCAHWCYKKKKELNLPVLLSKFILKFHWAKEFRPQHRLKLQPCVRWHRHFNLP
jgi:galactokinase